MCARNILLAFALMSIEVTVSYLTDFPLGSRELEVRAGYYTASGKYLGGIPKIESDTQLLECTGFKTDSDSSATIPTTRTDGNATATTDGTEGNATMCMSWTSDEFGQGAKHVGTCSCQSVANDKYCAAWTCNQPGVVNTLCTCATEDVESKKFCSSWTCAETGLKGNQALGAYQCVTASNSSDFCEAWTGVIEGANNIEMSACECVGQWDGVSVCSYWECRERQLKMCLGASGSWCSIGVSLGVGGFIGSWGAVAIAYSIHNLYVYPPVPDSVIRIGIPGFFWMTAWLVGVVVWGGQDGALYAGLWWGSIIVVGWLCRYPGTYATFRSRVAHWREKPDAPIPN